MMIFTINGVFNITGRGTVISGMREGDYAYTGDILWNGKLKTRVRGMEMFCVPFEMAQEKTMGLLVDLPEESFKVGDIWVKGNVLERLGWRLFCYTRKDKTV